MSEKQIPPNSIACGPDDMGFTYRGELSNALAQLNDTVEQLGAAVEAVEAGRELLRSLSYANYVSEGENDFFKKNPRVDRAIKELARLSYKVTT